MTHNMNTQTFCVVIHRKENVSTYTVCIWACWQQICFDDTVLELLFQVAPRLTLICVCVYLCIYTFISVWDSRCILCLLIRLGDLPVAVDHLYQQPEGQEHQQHIHHYLREERCGVLTGCGAQRTAGDIYYSAHILRLNVSVLEQKRLIHSHV